MTELFAANLAIIQQRWPILAALLQDQNIGELDAALVTGRVQTISVNGIQLSSRHDRAAEAQLLISTLPANASKVTLYGTGMGDVQSFLIEHKNLKTLDVVIMSAPLFALVCHYTDQSEWLQDPRVKLQYLCDEQPVRGPRLTLIPDLMLCDDEHAVLRDLLLLELNLEFTNRQHSGQDPELMERFRMNQALMQTDADVSVLASQFKRRRVIVMGSGPSLEEHYPYLHGLMKDQDRPLLIAVDTALKGLLHHGIRPDIVMCVDGKIDLYHLPLQDSDGINLVYFPRVAPAILQAWKGPRYCAYGSSRLYDTLMHSLPRTRLFINGSVIHPAIDLAVKLQAWEIILMGCDFCYCHGKSHAFWHSQQIDEGDGKYWLEHLAQSVHRQRHWVLDGRGNRVPTDLNLRAYLRSLEHYIAKHANVHFYQSSLASARIRGAQYREIHL